MCHNGLLYQEILLTKCFLISIGLYGLLQTQMQETSISLTRNSSAAIIRIMQLVHFGRKTNTSWRRGKLPRSFASLTLYRHIKAADQRTIIQQYGDWYTGHIDGWSVTFGTVRRGLCKLQSRPVLLAVTNVNSPLMNGQCTNCILFDLGIYR